MFPKHFPKTIPRRLFTTNHYLENSCLENRRLENHCPMVIGRVRAWLKYRLDKLFDQEGSSRPNSNRKFARRESPSDAFVATTPGNGYFSFRKSKLRKSASAPRIAFRSTGRCRGSF